MADTVDRILDALDVGLQASRETGYGTDRGGDRCARCQQTEPDGDGDLCAPCRAFLLGDTDDDPKVRSPFSSTVTRVAWIPLATEIHVDLEPLREAIGRCAEQAARAMEAISAAGTDIATAIENIQAAVTEHNVDLASALEQLEPVPEPPTARPFHCPAHGPQRRGGHCRVCARRHTRSLR